MGISVIVSYWNGRQLAEANLPSAMAAVQRLNEPWEVIAVDDGSTDGTAEFIRTHFPAVRLVERSRNGGFSAAMRSGIEVARQDILYFLNSDVRVELAAFETILKGFRDKQVCAITSLDIDKKPFSVPVATRHWGLLGVRYLSIPQPQAPVEVLFATGGHSAYRAAVYKQLGGYDELYAPAYWEDIDFGVRAHAAGWKILLEPQSRVHHQPRGTMARKYNARQIEELRASHRWWFTQRHSADVGARSWAALALSHGIGACPPFSTRFRRTLPIKSQAAASATVLRRFSAAAVKHAQSIPWRIAFVSPTGFMAGGGEASLVTLMGSLDRRQVRPVLVCPAEGPLAAQSRAAGIHAHILNTPATSQGLVDGSVQRFAAWLKANEIDLVHINSAGRALMLWGLAARLLGIPVIWHVRVATKEPVTDAFGAALANRLIVTSAYVASRFNQKKQRKKMVQIANPVDLEIFSPKTEGAAWRKHHGFGDGICVGVFGRLDAWKRFDWALQALAIARNKLPKLRMVIIGDGPERLRLESLAQRLGLVGAVSFVGWQYQPQEAMAAVDIVLHPAPTEHFGRVFIEAMASGKPAVAPKAGGAAELVIHQTTGLLTAADPAAFSESIVRLAQDEPLRKQMGVAARQRAEALFAPASIARQVTAVYTEVLMLS